MGQCQLSNRVKIQYCKDNNDACFPAIWMPYLLARRDPFLFWLWLIICHFQCIRCTMLSTLSCMFRNHTSLNSEVILNPYLLVKCALHFFFHFLTSNHIHIFLVMLFSPAIYSLNSYCKAEFLYNKLDHCTLKSCSITSYMYSCYKHVKM